MTEPGNGYLHISSQGFRYFQGTIALQSNYGCVSSKCTHPNWPLALLGNFSGIFNFLLKAGNVP